MIEQLRITCFQRCEGGFYTARVTANGGDTIRVDNARGAWSFTIDQRADPTARNVPRRHVLPAVAARLEKKRRAFERGETDETESPTLLEA